MSLIDRAGRRWARHAVIGWTRTGPVWQIAGGAPEAGETDRPAPSFTLDDLRGRTPEELQEIVQVADAHLRSLHQTDAGELRDLTDDEQAAFNQLLEVREKALAKLEEHRRISEVLRRRPESVERAYDAIRHGLDDGLAGDVRRLTVPEARDRALRTLDDRTATMHLSGEQKSDLERKVRRDPDIARRILVTEHDDYRSAWQKLVTHPRPILSPEEQRAVLAWEEYRTMGEVTPGAGGFGIPVFIDPSIILTEQGDANPFLQVAKQVNVNTNIWKGVSSAGVSWSFDTEGAEVSDDSPTLLQPSVTVHTARGFIPFSIEVGQDYPGFADEMATLLASGYDDLLCSKFSSGSGSGEPKGIITALDADTTAEVLMTTLGALGEVDIYAAWAALPQRFRQRASWMMSVGVNNAIRRMGTANVFHASTINLQDEWVDRLFNRRVYEGSYFPDVVATTGHVNQLVVGDFSNYVIARRAGMTVELVPLLFGVTTGRPTGQRGWFAYARIGGDVATSKAFKLLNQT